MTMRQRVNFPEYLKIAVLLAPTNQHTPPYAFKTNENTIYLLSASLLTILIRIFHFKIKLVQPEDGQYGNLLSDKNWTGLVGLLQREEADLAVSTLILNYQRSLVIHYSYPYKYGPITFITDEPQHGANSFAIIHPFSITVWIGFFASLIFILVISVVFESKRVSSKFRLNIYGSVLLNMTDFSIEHYSTKLLFISWLLSAFFITQSYKAVLLSSLILPIHTGIKTIEELSLASDIESFKCSTYKGSSIYSNLLESNLRNWMKIAECLNRTNMFTNNPLTFVRPQTYKKVFIGLKHHLDSFNDGYLSSEDTFFTNMIGIGTRKSFCCKEALDQAIHQLAASGILDKFLRDEYFFSQLLSKRQETHNTHFEEEHDKRKLSLQDFYGAFFCLFFGYILSVVALAVELLFYRKYKILDRRCLGFRHFENKLRNPKIFSSFCQQWL